MNDNDQTYEPGDIDRFYELLGMVGIERPADKPEVKPCPRCGTHVATWGGTIACPKHP